MHENLAGIRLAPARFAELAVLCEADPKFPHRYPAWQRLLQEARRIAADAGHSVPQIDLDPFAFGEWCESVGVVPCVEALCAFAVSRRNRPLCEPERQQSAKRPPPLLNEEKGRNTPGKAWPFPAPQTPGHRAAP